MNCEWDLQNRRIYLLLIIVYEAEISMDRIKSMETDPQVDHLDFTRPSSFY